MSRTKLGLLIFLFAFNSISLYLYFSSHPDHSPHSPPSENHQSLTGNGHTLTDNPHNFSLSKPWPILPSYLPWSLNPNVPFRSCESYFGNGFTRRIDLLKSSLSHHRTGGWFRSSNCEKLSDPDQHLEHSYLTMNQNPKDPESPTFETFMKLIRRLTHYPKSLYTK